MEATAGIEPAIRVLQTPALPLGYVATSSERAMIVPRVSRVREYSSRKRRSSLLLVVSSVMA